MDKYHASYHFVERKKTVILQYEAIGRSRQDVVGVEEEPAFGFFAVLKKLPKYY